MENNTCVNDHYDQMLAMRKHIEGTPEIWAAAGDAAINALMAEIYYGKGNKSQLWGIFDQIVDAVYHEVNADDMKRIAPAWNTEKYSGELIACALENILEDFED